MKGAKSSDYTPSFLIIFVFSFFPIFLVLSLFLSSLVDLRSTSRTSLFMIKFFFDQKNFSILAMASGDVSMGKTLNPPTFLLTSITIAAPSAKNRTSDFPAEKSSALLATFGVGTGFTIVIS